MLNALNQSTIGDREYKIRLAELAVEWVKTRIQVDSHTLPSLQKAILDIHELLNSLDNHETESEKEIGTKLVCCLPGDGAQVTEAEWGRLVAKRNQLGRMLTENETVEVLKEDREPRSSS